MPPTALVGAAFAAGIIAGETWLPGIPSIGALAAALFVGGLVALPALRARGVALMVLMCIAGVARSELPPADGSFAARAASYAGEVVVAEGTAAADPHPSANGYSVLMDVTRLSAEAGPMATAGRVLLRSRFGYPPSVGDGLNVTGRLRLPAEAPGFDRRGYLAQRGAWLELVATQVSVTASSSWLGDVPARLRADYRAAIITAVPQPHSAVLVGIVLGIRSGVPPRLEQDLIATGLVHLLVLSGLKVAVFARLLGAGLEPLLGGWSTLPVLLLVAAYALVGGATPAAVRAAAMGALVLLGSRLGRPAHVWTSLALTAAAMLAWEPALVFDVGFQLSFMGTAAIVLWTPAIERRLAWLPSLFREPMAVTTAAQIGTLPVTAAGFHLLSPVAPLANALTLPLLPALIAGGLLIGPLTLLPAIARLAALPLDGLLAYLEQVAALLARLPGAAVAVPDPPSWLGVAYYAVAGGAYGAARSTGGTRRLAIALAAVLPLTLASGELVAWSHAGATVTVLDVGDGQAVLAGGADGWVLIDGGPSPSRLADEMGRRLPPWTRRIDALLVTAPGAAHVGGLAAFPFAVDRVFLPRTGPGGDAARDAVLALSARGARVSSVGAGDRLDIAGLRIDVLAPEATDPSDQAGTGYVAIRISGRGGGSFCAFSDLDPDAQVQAAARLQGPCDAVLLPGFGRSLPAPELLQRAGRAEFVLSAAAGRPARGLPQGRLRRTDQEGPISFRL